MHILKALCWMLMGIRLTLFLTNNNLMVQKVGFMLLFISLITQLLVYLREHQPSWERINAVGEPKLSILESFGANTATESLPAPATPVAEPADRSPVKRLLDDDR